MLTLSKPKWLRRMPVPVWYGGRRACRLAKRIAGILTRAITAMEWCSSDPLCITDMMGAHNAFSHSACHSCVLAPETSCERGNKYLDRSVLVSTIEREDLAFFPTVNG